MEPLPSTIIARENAVLDRLRGCQTLSDVADAMAAVAAEVKALEAHDPVFTTIARNLVRYLRIGLSEGWLPRACDLAYDCLGKSEPAEGVAPRTGSDRNADNGGQANG